MAATRSASRPKASPRRRTGKAGKVGKAEQHRRKAILTPAPAPAPAPASSPLPAPAPPHAAASHAATAARVHSMVERELDAVARVLDVLGPDDAGDAERTARTLASIARTLREIAQINEAEGDTEAVTADDDDSSRDLDEFRRDLARRIEAFVDERAGAGLPGDAAAQRDRGSGA